MSDREEEKFVWYKTGSIWLVILILAMAFLNLFLGNPLGR